MPRSRASLVVLASAAAALVVVAVAVGRSTAIGFAVLAGFAWLAASSFGHWRRRDAEVDREVSRRYAERARDGRPGQGP